MAARVVTNFMRQQGYPPEGEPACDMRFEGLYFQPRIVFPLVLLAILLQSAALFLALAAVLAWNVALPRLNPFEAAYNRLVAARRGRAPLTPAPGPRRFAQAMAAAFNLGSGLAVASGATVVAAVFQVLLVVAFSALLFGKFCLGAYLYHLLRGRVAFANATLPWARG
jgi:Domain of unknown function (DUF4395)